MKITTKTSPQGVAIDFIQYERTTPESVLRHARTMNRIRLEELNRREAARKQRLSEAGVR